MRLFYVLGFAWGMVLLTGCAATRYQIPPKGTATCGEHVSLDDKNNLILDLTGLAEVQYRAFSIRNPKDPRFQVRLNENTVDSAQWRAAPDILPYLFLCTVRRASLGGEKSLGQIQSLYKGIFTQDPRTIQYTGERTRLGEYDAVGFTLRGRSPENGSLLLIQGYCLPDPTDPNFLIDIRVMQVGYDKDVNHPDALEMAALFPTLVQIGKKQ